MLILMFQYTKTKIKSIYLKKILDYICIKSENTSGNEEIYKINYQKLVEIN